MNANTQFEVNICGGDFQHVLECFHEWKGEPLIYRRDRLMFEGRDEVRMLCQDQFDDAERARKALETACLPHDPYALATRVDDGVRDLWIVMAAYCE
ncbi:hypothetical protein PQR46_12050 [Paraburkholderia sediminicola]|uniref:hypothetical protein n=1 Tax=Paraburkholderia sediminicola TaxID=458836 RepID=UPI0038BCF507